MKHLCPVCGYPHLTEAIYTSGKGPSYEICHSCTYQYGYEDLMGISYDKWRTQWIAEGMKWRGSSTPPLGWDPKKQLENIGIYL